MTPEPQRIDAEAASWAVRLQTRPLEPNEESELEAWLAADIRHRGALVRAQAAWLHLDRLAALAGRGVVPAPRPSRWAGGGEASRRWFLAAGLSSVALMGTGAWWEWHRRGEVYNSEVGEVRRVTLPDGSGMVLNTASRAAVHFSPGLREVVLLSGEALFEVVKDRARAFVVRAGTVSVRAVGTAFVVRAIDRKVAVTVTEGVVQVADADAPAPAQPQTVSANQQAVITKVEGVRVQQIAHVEAERHLAWREGMLVFDGEPLAEAVQEINRHNRQQIAIDDAALAARPVVGIFRASDTEGFAQTVATVLGARSVIDGEVIHLRPLSTP